jgi:hypothetical protein
MNAVSPASTMGPEWRSRPGERPTAIAPWRETLLARIAELRTLADWLTANVRQAGETLPQAVLASATQHLEVATDIALGRRGAWPGRFVRALSGADQERASANVDAAEVDLLRIAPLSYLRGQLPSLRERVTSTLPLGDPRRASVELIGLQSEFTPLEHESLLAALHAANVAARRQAAAVRSVRNTLLVVGSLLLALAVGLAVLGMVDDDVLPLCFEFPGGATCPTRTVIGGADPVARATTPWDILLVETVGMLGGALGAASALRSVLGVSSPYSLAAVLTAIKLPAGALTAIVGILLMRGSFVPGIGSLQSSAQIIAWALIWGLAQQLITRYADRSAERLVGAGLVIAATPATSGPTAVDIDRAVETSLQARLAGPTMINFHGEVSVTVPETERSGEAQALFLVPSGVVPTIVVTIGRTAAPGAVSAPLVVDAGEDAPTVPFVVTVDGERVVSRAERSLTVADGGDAEPLVFALSLELDEQPSRVWVRVVQHGRLLQLVVVELAAAR